MEREHSIFLLTLLKGYSYTQSRFLMDRENILTIIGHLKFNQVKFLQRVKQLIQQDSVTMKHSDLSEKYGIPKLIIADIVQKTEPQSNNQQNLEPKNFSFFNKTQFQNQQLEQCQIKKSVKEDFEAFHNRQQNNFCQTSEQESQNGQNLEIEHQSGSQREQESVFLTPQVLQSINNDNINSESNNNENSSNCGELSHQNESFENHIQQEFPVVKKKQQQRGRKKATDFINKHLQITTSAKKLKLYYD